MRILWIKTEFLHPVDKGGRIRTYQMLREIAKSHHVTYLTLDDGTAAPDAPALASEYATDVVRIPFAPPAKGTPGFFRDLLGNVLSPLPYAVSRYRSAAMAREVARLTDKVDVVVCDFLAPAVNVPRTVGTPTVLFQHNVEAMIWERHAAVATGIKKRYMAEQWRRMERFERSECLRFDHVIAVSPQDTEVMRSRYGVTRVSDVPTGVDIDYFTPAGTGERRPLELVFTGSMDWMPNDDAMIWFATDVLPLVRAKVPDVHVTIVGRTPSARLQALAAASGMEVTGRVPDVRPYLERASAFIVPMRVGGGTRLKIYEAMSMGLPVISTSIGAEGLPVVDNETAVLRDDPRSFADAVVRMLEVDDERRRIAEAGQRLVRARFGWSGVADAFMETCASVVEGSSRSRGERVLTSSVQG
jgi:glycosyltransferase involved in cell wall biosynthesis